MTPSPKDFSSHPAYANALREAVEAVRVHALALLSFDATEGADGGAWLAVSALERELRDMLSGAAPAVADARTSAAAIRQAALAEAAEVCESEAAWFRDHLGAYEAVTPASDGYTATMQCALIAESLAREIRALARESDDHGGTRGDAR